MGMIDVMIYLPIYYNDGAKVEDEKFNETFEELAERFGGGTIYEGVKGIWYSQGKKFVDEIKIIEITVPDTPEIKEWFSAYAKGTLEHRFKQEKIWLKFRKSEID
jgi:hypothetical protein